MQTYSFQVSTLFNETKITNIELFQFKINKRLHDEETCWWIFQNAKFSARWSPESYKFLTFDRNRG